MRKLVHSFMLGCGVLLALQLPVLAQSQQQFGSIVPAPELLSRYGLEAAWTAQAVLSPTRDKISHFALDEDLVYAQASNGMITALDGETGRQVWAQRLGRFDEPVFPAVTNQDVVLVVVGGSMYGLDKQTGSQLWVLRLPGAPSTGPAVDEEQVYVGTLDGSVYAFSLRKIRQLYLDRRLPQWSIDAQVWRHKASKEITSPPISSGRTVNFASRDGSLYSVTTVRHELNFQFETDYPIVAPMARVGDTQFLASEGFAFYALDAERGNVRWEFVTGLPIRKAPYAIDTTLYITPDRGGLYALDVDTGEQKWWQPRLTDFVGLAERMLFARDIDGNVAMVDQPTGRMIGRLPLRGFPRQVANDRTDRMYVGTDSGRILAIRLKDRDLPTFHKYPERRPILPEFEPEEPAAEPAPVENPAQ